MSGRKIVVRLEYNQDVAALLKNIDKLLNNTRRPDLVYVKLSSAWFPNRFLDLPKELQRAFTANPSLKALWDCELDFLNEDEYEVLGLGDCKRIGKDFIEKHAESCKHEYLDMTMVSVFYDASINPLRKVATSKAVNCWMKQKHLPREMMFVELGFNGEFTFSQDDFPKEIQYVRLYGDDTHKYLFQKEHLWNIAAKRAKFEKLMFVDSDIAPLDNVDWFKKVYESLDKCLFTQGYHNISYLDVNDNETPRCKKSFSSQLVDCSIDRILNICAPGGVFCIEKTTLQHIGYFNFLPLGGGDILFWTEFNDI